MILKVETNNKFRKGDIFNAYNEAMQKPTLKEFKNSLAENIGDSIVGQGSNHIWISEKSTGERIAIISNLLNC